MAEYWVDAAGGSDSNDGLDRFGFGLTTASWTASTKRVTQSGAFSGYTWTAGDRIYLSHASITDGLYEIASRVDGDTIELVNSIFGSDLTNVASSTGPWATIGKTLDVVTAGGKVWIKASGDYTTQHGTNGAIGALKTAGGDTSPVVLEGYGGWPGDGARATLDASAAGLASCLKAATGGAAANHVFKNLVCTGATGNGFHLGSEVGMTFKNCAAHDNGDRGIRCGANSLLAECEAYDNGQVGFDAGTNCVLLACRSHENVAVQIAAQSGSVLLFCRVYGLANGPPGVSVPNTGNTIVVIANMTVDGDGPSAGSAISVTGRAVLVNNIVYDVATAMSSAFNTGELTILRNNLFATYATKLVNLADHPSNVDLGGSGDPLFVDEAGRDYRLRSLSPAKGAGLPAYLDIGAVQRRETATIGGPTNRGMQT